MGNQGSGKSTVAKLISTFRWIEKALFRGDYDEKWFQQKNRFKNTFLTYHRIENYLTEETHIIYEGDAYHIEYKDSFLHIEERRNTYELPQIMYVPSERNFISYVKSPKELKLSSEALKEFLTEFENAKRALKNTIRLPINDTDLEYDRLNDTINLKSDTFKIKLTESASGFQSLVPLYLVMEYLSSRRDLRDGSMTRDGSAKRNGDSMSLEEVERFKKGIQDILNNENLTDEQRRAAISVLSSKFNKTAFVHIIEEPEQNLFPSSQWKLLQKILESNNVRPENNVLMTTHSPYIISYLSIAIQAGALKAKLDKAGADSTLYTRLYEIVPEQSLLSIDDTAIFELNELDGSIKKLPSYYGVPTDNNFLNILLNDGNVLFDTLLEIEEDIDL
jgi:ABC-type lipoprotein export system ATPase subunit